MLLKKKHFFASIMLFSCQKEEKINNLTLSYNQPDNVWMTTLPIGNSSSRAMIFGKPDQEIIRLKHD